MIQCIVDFFEFGDAEFIDPLILTRPVLAFPNNGPVDLFWKIIRKSNFHAIWILDMVSCDPRKVFGLIRVIFDIGLLYLSDRTHST